MTPSKSGTTSLTVMNQGNQTIAIWCLCHPLLGKDKFVLMAICMTIHVTLACAVSALETQTHRETMTETIDKFWIIQIQPHPCCLWYYFWTGWRRRVSSKVLKTKLMWLAPDFYCSSIVGRRNVKRVEMHRLIPNILIKAWRTALTGPLFRRPRRERAQHSACPLLVINGGFCANRPRFM